MKRTYEPREFTNRLTEYLTETGEINSTIIELLNYMSDDDVRDFAETYGYFDPDDYDD